MKRLISIFLVLAMLLTLAPMNIFAAEADKPVFSDMKDTDYYAQAATALEQLDILAGYPDGTFGAEKSITRAEMAAIVCRMIDKETDAEKAKGETAFDDVNSDHWASGYINIASKEGIINGDGNGKFRPEDDVMHEEAIKMVVCALGYGADIEIDPADWSKGYLEVADKKGISTALKGTKGKASTRGDVAVMSYNGLSVDLVAPTASLKAGNYTGTKSVKLETTTKGAEIYYTTDGSTPTAKGTKYTKAISISKTCTLKAITVKDGVLVSDVLSVDYTIKRSSGGGGSSRPSTPSTYTVSFDLNYEGATGAPAVQTITSGSTATEPDAPTNGSYQFVGWFINKDETDLDNYYDFSTPVESNITLFAKWMDMTDTDGDGLVDGLEELYGTDKTLIDTDSDALNDYIEIFTFGTNPLLQDSDNNGTNDGDEDFDSDGLSNLTEINGSTDPINADSDYDSLLDGEEITLGTNPNEEDTDEDGVSDSKEIELGTDPLVPQATFSMNLSADNDGEGATASVQMELSGEQVETLSIDPVNDETFFPETMPGYMGQAYDFNVEGEFDSADISFEFDASKLGNNAELAIYYFNEETQQFEELPTTINGNVATTTVSHFSTYILLNKVEFEEVWNTEIKPPIAEDDGSEATIDIAFVIDYSLSMDWNDPNKLFKALSKEFISKLREGKDKAAVVKFIKRATLVSELTTDKEQLNAAVDSISYDNGYGTYSGTDGSAGYKMALDALSSSDSKYQYIILITDGEDNGYSYDYDDLIASSIENNVVVYTVGMGSASESVLKKVAQETNGKYYYATTGTASGDIIDLENVFEDIQSETVDKTTDTNIDGIPDYYNELIKNGTLLLSNGTAKFNGIDFTYDKDGNLSDDYDGDGLKNGEEIQVVHRGNYVYLFFVSNPTMKDTDKDGYADADDINKTIPYKTPVVLIHGWTSNTTWFGAETKIGDGENNAYDKTSTEDGDIYTNIDSQTIIDVYDGMLADYLTDCDYKINKNLFAFNYPNEDMVQYNAGKLQAFIEELVNKAIKYDDSYAGYIFPTSAARNSEVANIILVGHSMGGLVSRYYIENLGGKHIEKLITIDTPHYGSGLANAADKVDVAAWAGKYNPGTYDLDTKSTLYGGKPKKWDWSIAAHKDTEYAINNQSPALHGNKNSNVKYYAICGYDVGQGGNTDFINPWTELDQIAESIQGHLVADLGFSFEFQRDVTSKAALKDCINTELNNISMLCYNEESRLDLGDTDGDNTVDYMSQLAVRFGKNYDYQNLERTVLILATGYNKLKPFHNGIQYYRDMHRYVEEFIND